jgi:hypothetical protein
MKRVIPTPPVEDDGGLRFPRTLEEAFGCGNVHRLAVIKEPDRKTSADRRDMIKHVAVRIVYVVAVLMLMGLAARYRNG